MPELPEVETIKNDLAPDVVGHTITGIRFKWPGVVKNLSPDALEKSIVGRRITGMGRRGKYLLFRLDDGKTLVMHLKMSGSLHLVRGDSEPADPHIRTVIFLDNGCVAFRDLRRFGALWLIDDEGEFFHRLGPEPLERGFTVGLLEKLLMPHASPIKAVLLDQSVLAGVGNMYADEALFEAGIHPQKRANELAKREIRRLHRAIRNCSWEKPLLPSGRR
jgi:formamidopyrimidine-DNA glycosylase